MLIDAVILYILFEMQAPAWTSVLVAVDIILKLLHELIDI